MWGSSNSSNSSMTNQRRVIPTSTLPPCGITSLPPPSTTATSTNTNGFDRLLLLRQMNQVVFNNTGNSNTLYDGGRSVLGGNTSSSQNHKERMLNESKRRQEVLFMSQEDIWLQDPSRFQRQLERTLMEQEEKKMNFFLKQEKKLKQENEETKKKEQFLLKIRLEKEENEKKQKEKEIEKKMQFEKRSLFLKEQADQKAREAKQKLIEIELQQKEIDQMEKEETKSFEFHLFLKEKEEKQKKIDLETKKWLELEIEMQKQQELETLQRRQTKAKEYEAKKQKQMALHQLTKQQQQQQQKQKHQQLTSGLTDIKKIDNVATTTSTDTVTSTSTNSTTTTTTDNLSLPVSPTDISTLPTVDKQVEVVQEKNEMKILMDQLLIQNLKSFEELTQVLNGLVPFAQVTSVSSHSPADLAKLEVNDLILSFDVDILHSTPKCLLALGQKVQQKIGQKIPLQILRAIHTNQNQNVHVDTTHSSIFYQVLGLELIPNHWKGKGLLGCNLAPYKILSSTNNSSTVISTSGKQEEVGSRSEEEEKEEGIRGAFLLVENIKRGSPAEESGLIEGDLLLQLDTITQQTPNGMKLIARTVANSIEKPLYLKIFRIKEQKYLDLWMTPKKWHGDGLLGCKLSLLTSTTTTPTATTINTSSSNITIGHGPPCHSVGVEQQQQEYSMGEYQQEEVEDTCSSSFLVFNAIQEDSPAQESGLMDGDILIQMGDLDMSIVNTNTQQQEDQVLSLLEKVQHYISTKVEFQIPITIQRWNQEENIYETFELTLFPHTQWHGVGLLGCQLTTYQQYYLNNSLMCEECMSSTITPVHTASFHGHVKCLQTFFHSSTTTMSTSSAIAAINFDKKNLVQMLDSNGRSPLFYACYGNQLKCLELLLDYLLTHSSYTINTTEDQEDELFNKLLIDFNGDTCLHAACSSGSLQVISFLLTKKANPDIPNQIGMTCVHVASNVQVLELLAGQQQQQVDLLALDFYGRMPLCYFCLTGDVQSVAFLIEQHPDFVDYADEEGNTPLHFGVMTNQVDILKLLSVYLTEIAYFLPNQNGLNAFELAKSLQQQEAIDFLTKFYPTK